MPRIIAAPELQFLVADARDIAQRLGLGGHTIVLWPACGPHSYVDSDTPTIVFLSLRQAQRLRIHPRRVLAHELQHVQQYVTRRLVVASEEHGTWAWWDGSMVRIEDGGPLPWEAEAEAFERQYV